MEPWPDWDGGGSDLLPRQRFTEERRVAPPKRGARQCPMHLIAGELVRALGRHGIAITGSETSEESWLLLARWLLTMGITPTTGEQKTKAARAVARLVREHDRSVPEKS